MAGRYDRINGAYCKVRKRYDRISGAWTPVKKRLDKVNGVWVPSYTGIDCQAHNYNTRMYAIDANGVVSSPQTTIPMGNLAIQFSLTFQTPISFTKGQHLATLKYNVETLTFVAICKDYGIYSTDRITDTVDGSGPTNGEYDLTANQSGSLNTFYFLFEYGNGGLNFSTQPGAITIGGIQISNVELI